MRRVRLTETILHDDGSESEIPRTDVWPIPTLTSGFVVDRNGVATARYANRWKSLGVPFTPTNRRAAVKSAEAWILGLRRAENAAGTATTGAAIAGAGTAMTWPVVWLEYEGAKLNPNGTTRERAAHRLGDRAFRLFLEGSPDVAVNDQTALALTRDGVARARERFAEGTAAQYAGAWSRFLAYCRALGVITSDPLALVRRPRQIAKPQARVYTDRELLQIDRWYARHGGVNQRWHRLFLRFLLVTGCRVHEAIALRWSDVMDAPGDIGLIDFRIAKGDRPRPFPLEPFPEVRALLDRIRREAPFRATGAQIVDGGKVFPWSGPFNHSLTDIRDRCWRACAIDGGPRPIHVFRATASHRWRERGIPPELRARLAGHSVEIMLSHYDAAASARELAERITASTGRGAR
jgi:integrase